MLEMADEHFGLWCRYRHAFKEYKLMQNVSNSYEPRNVIVITGPTGTGKTRWAIERHPDAYIKPDNCKWYDGYDGATTILLDDFYGWLPYSHMLRIADGYRVTGETKGGVVPLRHNTLVITSNREFRKWYSFEMDALRRRVSQWIFISDELNMCTDYEDYCGHYE